MRQAGWLLIAVFRCTRVLYQQGLSTLRYRCILFCAVRDRVVSCIARGRVPLVLCLGVTMCASIAFRNASVVGRNACTVSQPLDAGAVGISLSVRCVDFFVRL